MIKSYEGQIEVKDYGDSDDVLFLSGMNYPLADILEEDIVGKQVTVRYWITFYKCSREEAKKAFLQKLFGEFKAEFCARYSEITGYLWTDEELNVGGHDLLRELKSSHGEWLILEIEVH